MGRYCLTVIEVEEVNVEKGREIWGMPKKLGSIDLVDDGARVHAYVERKGHLLVELTAQIADGPQVSSAETSASTYFELKGHLAANGVEVRDPELVVTDIASTVRRVQAVAGADVRLGHSPFDPGVATIPVGDFLDGCTVAGVSDYALREVIPLAGDGHDYTPYVFGRLYSPLVFEPRP
ncbi:MAG TPA: acetoacetate decarboxylase family protein [Baekduia sp.]|uniref:acetoacetate decarboxylase family protein n=1 Tax=Baekduia sp. TaxID=2600305 RepID=UPI002D7968E3|nr:acetoacetate decarboxylase family protein [Baekduia sp.]HET6509128.1 acetoacetate decarboxylase family protein [Baekduia sp.]